MSNSAIGRTWAQARQELFTLEEIIASEERLAKKYTAAFSKFYGDVLEIHRDVLSPFCVIDDAGNCRFCPFLGLNCPAPEDETFNCREAILKYYLEKTK